MGVYVVTTSEVLRKWLSTSSTHVNAVLGCGALDSFRIPVRGGGG